MLTNLSPNGNFDDFIKGIVKLANSGTITHCSESFDTKDRSNLLNYIFKGELKHFLRIALEQNDQISVGILLDYYGVPNSIDLSFKQRLALYRLEVNTD